MGRAERQAWKQRGGENDPGDNNGYPEMANT
jgi:hypothetical protein